MPRGSITVFILHGIMGSRRNWRSFASRLQAAEPSWRLVLIDLRCHGHARDVEGPHTLSSASADVWKLIKAIGRPDYVLGHSFGGKVALQLARDRATDPDAPWQTWVLDCPPFAVNSVSIEESEVGRVLIQLRSMVEPITRRSDVMSEFQSAGFSRSLSGWMSTNIEKGEDGVFRWRFDVAGVRDLLHSYWQTDFMEFLQQRYRSVHFVVARKSDRWTSAELMQMQSLAHRRLITLHHLANAGHWLHIDNPVGLISLLRS